MDVAASNGQYRLLTSLNVLRHETVCASIARDTCFVNGGLQGIRINVFIIIVIIIIINIIIRDN